MLTYEELQAENARLKSLMEWRPIDEAPKDKGEILARSANGAVWLVLWEEDHWAVLTTEWRSYEVTDLVDYMMIPEPPEVTP